MTGNIDFTSSAPTQPEYLDSSLPADERAADLVSRMSLEEKISQMSFEAPGIAHLGIPPYNWWNEALHGVARAGLATVFPQAIGLAASWNQDLIHRVATVISDEGRAKYHEAVRSGIHEIYRGLTFWSPNINIFRDPRWGRGQETYGEDPYLTARIGVAFVKGLQGDHPHYLKVAATPKHFAVHSGPEFDRHHFDARVDARDLYETYLPAFEACVVEGGAVSVMGAYNRTNGEPCCASPTLLQKILREAWGFDGYVVSDCGAIQDIYDNHRVVDTPEEAAALAVKAGCDLNCGSIYPALEAAVAQGLIAESEIDQAVIRLFTARFRLGMFDPPEQVPYAQIPISVNAGEAHRALALEAARESIVLLKNEGPLLPLSSHLKTIAVIGPNTADPLVLLGNYHGTPRESVTPLAGIRSYLPAETKVLHTTGCGVIDPLEGGPEAALEAAGRADVVVFVGGISQLLEGEEGQNEGLRGGAKTLGDRDGLGLPRVQQELLEKLHATGTPVVLVLLNGSPLAVNWAAEHLPAVLEVWYPGEAAGTAIAEVLFGAYNPAGRLPMTFHRSVKDLPPFEDYSMAGRTYRFFTGEPLFPFGYGLSYTTFVYRNLKLTPAQIGMDDPIELEVEVQNTGDRAGDEVVQVYVSLPDATVRTPIRQLQGFTRIHLAAGASETVRFTLAPRQRAVVTDQGEWMVEPGRVFLSIGGRQPTSEDQNQGALDICFGTVVVEGEPRLL